MIRVVAGVVVEDGRMMVALRGPEMAHAGQWELPGGKVEPGEADATALARELAEELGIRVMVGDHVGTSEVPIGGRTIQMHAYRCRIVEGRPAATEHARIAWVGPVELARLAWAPADVPLIPVLVQEVTC